RHRMMPAFARQSFLRLARRRGWTRPPEDPAGEPVALFVDVFANFNDTTIAEAAFLVLRHNGVPVFVPDRQSGCGMAPLAQGDVEAARRSAGRNVRALAELARSGYRIVCPEPTAALMLS